VRRNKAENRFKSLSYKKENMLDKATLKFLKDLAKNNNKEWFDAHRQQYETAKQNFIQLADKIIKDFCKKDKDFENLEAKKCLFRINRDIRFSKDKSPYKNNFGASFERGGRISPYAGYYLHIQPGNNSFIAGGVWQPEAERVKLIRQEVDYNWDDFKKIISNKKFKAIFGDLEKTKETSLSREPKGYEKDNPAIEYIKLKSWVVSASLKDEEVTDKDLVKKIITGFETMQPFIEFLNHSLAQ
jgi:uncharacterized protein (TIGR02453 family)